MNSKITRIIAEDAQGYFTADLDNGGVRIGLRGCECFSFINTHPLYNRIIALYASQIEAVHDECMGRYASDLNWTNIEAAA